MPASLSSADLARARLILRARALEAKKPVRSSAPDDWPTWLRTMFPSSVGTFAPHHAEFWDWVWSIREDVRPRPFVGIWPRGGGKSTGAELATAALGVRGVRSYCLYVRETQEQADNSVTNIATLLEARTVEKHYPHHADRLLSKFGTSRGWRRNRLRTAGGFTVDAIGLDTAARGAKVEDQRPDLIIFDDIDGRHDSPAATAKKIATITRSLLPAGTDDAAVLGIQNLIIPNGVFARLADGRADFLVDRIVSGPHPALRAMKVDRQHDATLGKVRAVIVAGEPTWEGQDVAACQRLMDAIGYGAFVEECQQQVYEREGALWKRDMIARVDVRPVKMRRIVVAVDPSGGGEEIGIVAAGVGVDGKAYVLADVTQEGALGPLNWGNHTVGLYDDLKADRVVAEANFGGNLVEANIRVAAGKRRVPVTLVNASRGKAIRAEPVAALYEDGLVVHVGTFPDLEAEMTGWVPSDADSPNRLDALVWALTDLMLTGANTASLRPGSIGGPTRIPSWRIE